MVREQVSAAPGHVLALNSGSSSLKFGLYRVGPGDPVCLLSGQAEGLGTEAASFQASGEPSAPLLGPAGAPADVGQAMAHIGRWLTERQAPLPNAVGHRIVHGGPGLRAHTLIDARVMQELASAGRFAPLHTPAALALICCAAQQFPGLPQVACLDTAFHARMPPLARTLPLPRELRALGLERYGFHGLSCESILAQLAALATPAGWLPERLLIAHLGNGASITAVRQGQSIDTSMGLTPTGGLIMGTRSGDLDPGVLVHLMRETGLDAAAMENLIDHRCGLLGLSGLSSDMRLLHAAADGSTSGKADARLAIDLFCYAAAKELGAMAVALGGVDHIVFTGGMGEHDARVRAAICARLACLGVQLGVARNQRGQGLISADVSGCVVQVLPSQEDDQIARHTAALCGLSSRLSG